MPPEDQVLSQITVVVRTAAALLAFGPFAVGLIFLVRSRRAQETQRPRWEVPRLVASFGQGAGMALVILSPTEAAGWIGLALFVVSAGIEVGLMRAERRAGA